jgi:Protein of unknown function VcgC/VcgE (DUF2780)
MNIQAMIDQVAAQAGLDLQSAERAAGTILSVIQQEVDAALATRLFDKLPGASDLATTHAVTTESGGFLSSIATSLLGAKAGTLAAGITQLQSIGLSIGQIETAAATLMAYVKANAGSMLAGQVAASLPGLAPAKV